MTFQSLMDNGSLGKIIEFESHYDRDVPTPPKAWRLKEWVPGIGLMFGIGSHIIDQALVTFGRPKSVTAFLRYTSPEFAIEDWFTILLSYGEEKRNLVVTLKSSNSSKLSPQPRLMVRGENGSYVKVCILAFFCPRPFPTQSF